MRADTASVAPPAVEVVTDMRVFHRQDSVVVWVHGENEDSEPQRSRAPGTGQEARTR